jgi:hypothetical protein
MIDEVKAVDTKGVELKTLDTLAMWSWLNRCGHGIIWGYIFI